MIRKLLHTGAIPPPLLLLRIKYSVLRNIPEIAKALDSAELYNNPVLPANLCDFRAGLVPQFVRDPDVHLDPLTHQPLQGPRQLEQCHGYDMMTNYNPDPGYKRL